MTETGKPDACQPASKLLVVHHAVLVTRRQARLQVQVLLVTNYRCCSIHRFHSFIFVQ